MTTAVSGCMAFTDKRGLALRQACKLCKGNKSVPTKFAHLTASIIAYLKMKTISCGFLEMARRVLYG
jgi:hypothetical protein